MSKTFTKIFEDDEQCDQMARLIFQNLAICKNHNLPNSLKCAKIGSKFWQMLSIPSKHCPKTLKSLLKRRNFAKSGHTDDEVA